MGGGLVLTVLMPTVSGHTAVVVAVAAVHRLATEHVMSMPSGPALPTHSTPDPAPLLPIPRPPSHGYSFIDTPLAPRPDGTTTVAATVVAGEGGSSSGGDGSVQERLVLLRRPEPNPR